MGEIPDTIITQIQLNNSHIKFDTLLDTGALQGNYVSKKYVEGLIKDNLVENGKQNMNVCAAFDECQHSDSYIVSDIVFNSRVVNKTKFLNKNNLFTLKLRLTVLEQLPFDMIIGRRDILKYNLLDKTEIVHRVNTLSVSAVPKVLMSRTGFRVFRKRKNKKSLFTMSNSPKQTQILIKEVRNSKLIVDQDNQRSSTSTAKLEVAESNTSTTQPSTTRTEAIHQVMKPIAKAAYHTVVQQIEDVSKASTGSVTAPDSGSMSLQQQIDLGLASTTPWVNFPQTEADNMDNRCAFTAYGYQPAIQPAYTIFAQRNDKASIKRKSKAMQEASSEVGEPELWNVTTTEQLNALLKNQNLTVNSPPDYALKSATAHDTNLQDTVNRTHISEFFHYEDDAQGIESTGSDLPIYQWDWDAKQPKLVGHKVNNAKNQHHSRSENLKTSEQTTSYIPTQISGSPELVRDIQTVCRKYLSVFNTCLSPEPALLEPMTLNVDHSKWHSNANKGPPRQQTAAKQEEIRKQIGKMLPNEVVSVSQAEYYSQVHLTPKPVHSLEVPLPLDGSTTDTTDATIPLAVQIAVGWRFCVDFRNLNLASTGLGWPIPNVPQMLRRLGDHKPKIFGKLDLTSGYHQAPLSLSSRAYTAFMTFMGVYEWCRVPMGLKGAGSYFQGVLASQVLSGLIYITCELYIDDLIVHAQDHKQFITNLDQLLAKLAAHKIRVNPDKCSFGMSEVEYVGHTINEHGLTFSRDKIDKVLQIDTPFLGKDLKSFLGVAVYFIDHIQNYASIVAPLHAMLHDYDRNRRLVWSEEGRVAFHRIKESINNCTTLFFIDEHSPITLTTDASDFGIGGYLSQVVDGVERPIAFVSHGLSGQEIRWSTIEKECYAIVYTLKKLNYLLGDRQFTLKTDHKNLTYLDADANEKVKRWKIAIQSYDMILEYIKGPLNTVADGMSRLVNSNKPIKCPVSHGLCVLREIPLVTFATLIEEINLAFAEDSRTATVATAEEESLNAILREFQVPHKEREIIAKVHNALAGHSGVERTFDRLVQQGHHWPFMREHVKYYIKNCAFCQKMSYLKTPIHTTPFTTAAYAPMQRQNWDSIGPLTLTTGETSYILVAIDCHSRWVELWLIPDVEMATVRLPMLQHFGRYGNPAQILTDNGTQFINGTVKELLQMINLQHITVLAYSKEENSIVERMNKEVMRHLRALVYEHSENENIEELLPSVQRIINANRNEANQTSPAELLFGNSINLDRGIFLQHSVLSDMNVSLSSWAATMLKAQGQIMRKAELLQRTKDAKHIAQADPRRSEFAVGSYVLLEYHSSILRKGPANKFNTQLRGPFKVLRKTGNMYTLWDSNTSKEIDTHIMLLHPFNFEPQYVDPTDIARRDVLSAFVVESISAHSGDTRTSAEFLVKWVGYDNSHDLWIPYKELRDVVALHEYLFDKNLKNLIPTQHRTGRFALVTRTKKTAAKPLAKTKEKKAKKAAKEPVKGRRVSTRSRS